MSSAELTLLRIVMAVMWLVTAALSFGLYPVEDSVLLLQKLPLRYDSKLLVLYSGAVLDLAMGLLTLLWPRRLLWLAQLLVVLSYSLLTIWLVPLQWLHPFGPLLKNLSVLALLWLLYRHTPTPGATR
jgi:hypothetical protein